MSKSKKGSSKTEASISEHISCDELIIFYVNTINTLN